MSAGVEIEVNATDNASATINNVNNSITNLGASTTSTGNVMVGMTTGTAARFTGMGVSIAAAYDMMSAYGSRFNMVQERVVIAQENITKALMTYGAGSIQVVQAQQQLNAVQEEAKYAQGEYNREMLMMSAMIIPQVISVMPNVIKLFTGVRTEAELARFSVLGLSAAMSTLLIAGVGAVALIGILAATGAFAGGAPTSNNNVNVYGNVNMQGYANPYQFGTSVQSWTQSMRG